MFYEKEKVVFKNGFDIYKDPDVIPITGVAEALGIEVSRSKTGCRISCPCPEHEDKNPSTDITMHGKYANSFKCWSCNEHGGPLELVMAVKYDITPSKFWAVMNDKTNMYSSKDHAMMIKARNDAAKFIEEYYPGAIEIEKYDTEGKKVVDTSLRRPELPPDVWNELKNWLNVGRSVGYQKMITISHPESGNKKLIDGYKEYLKLSDYEFGCLIYGKLDELESCLNLYKRQIFHDFPELDDAAKYVIMKKTNERIERIDIYKEQYKEYINKLHIMDDNDLEEELKNSDYSDIEKFMEEYEPEYKNNEEKE